MHSLPFLGRHPTARPTTLRLVPALARARLATPLAATVLLTGAIQLCAQSRVAPTSLVLQVTPEEHLQVQNGSVALKIRLARGAMARLWEAESCAAAAPDSQIILASGTYTIPLNTLTPASSNPASSTMEVCLGSSDGVLHDSQLVEISPTGSGAVAQGQPANLAPNDVSGNVPDGWRVTTKAGTTTWSNP